MKEFFRGWRRKVGSTTLVMACVAMVGWMRSISTVDIISVRGKSARYIFVSGGQALQVVSGAAVNLNCGANGDYDVKVIVIRGVPPFGRRFGWMVTNEPFSRVGIFLSRDDDMPCVNMIPYWSIVIPLTFISLWLLLLTKPRKSTQKKIAELTPVEGS